jgi:hypothetical protein
VVSILACHARDPGSIPGFGAFFIKNQLFLNILIKKNQKLIKINFLIDKEKNMDIE